MAQQSSCKRPMSTPKEEAEVNQNRINHTHVGGITQKVVDGAM